MDELYAYVMSVGRCWSLEVEVEVEIHDALCIVHHHHHESSTR